LETSSINGDRVQELERLDEEKRLQDEAGKRSKLVQEQEKKFYEKLEISENYQRRQAQQQATQDYAPTPPPPPKVNYDKPNKANQQRLEKLKVQELKERMKLKEMERRKRQIEEEIAREKKHLASLIHLEKESSPMTNAKNEAAELVSSPPPPPVPPTAPFAPLVFPELPPPARVTELPVMLEDTPSPPNGNPSVLPASPAPPPPPPALPLSDPLPPAYPCPEVPAPPEPSDSLPPPPDPPEA
jgi:hypothetical protein